MQIRLGHRALEAHEDEVLVVLNGVKASGLSVDHVDRLCQVAGFFIDLVDLNALVHHTTFNQQMQVRQQADVLEETRVLEFNKTVWLLYGVYEVEVLVLIDALLGKQHIKLQLLVVFQGVTPR